MEQKEAILTMLDNIEAGNNSEAQDIFKELLAQRVTTALDSAKADTAAKIYGTSQEQQA